MKRYFYTDPLAAAWMAKHFGMRYMMQEVSAMDSHTITSKHYIHPDSLHLLEPQVGDMVIDEDDGGNGVLISMPIQLPACEDSQIIQRNGLPFFTPESEEV